ncbi:MAG: NUDIX hydrolase [Lachnospiraceae bacterium]
MKNYTDVHKLTDNPFLNMYQIDAIDHNGEPFGYYFASRNDEAHIKHKTKSMEAEGIVIYPVYKPDPNKIVLIRQYRYPLDAWIYELPAGLIDAKETPSEAAVREMKEETGLDFTVYTGGSQIFRRPFFLGPGFTDETGSAVFGYAEGTISKAGQESTERIEVVLADKKEVRRILSEERVSLRGALLLMQFLQMPPEKPFLFLN